MNKYIKYEQLQDELASVSTNRDITKTHLLIYVNMYACCKSNNGIHKQSDIHPPPHLSHGKYNIFISWPIVIGIPT